MGINKVSSERKQSLRSLAKLMNKRHTMPFPITKPLLDCFEMVVSPEETDFLLRMGLKPHTYGEAASLSDSSEESFRSFFKALLEKGLVVSQWTENGQELFSVNGIMVGWFEVQLADGKETPDKKEFAHRVDRLFKSWQRMNFFPLRNYLNYRFRRGSKPHHSIVAINQPDKTNKKRQVIVDRAIALPETKVYPTKTIYELIDKYGKDNRIALVNCFCRQWRKMVNEPCRFNLPSEACIVIGDATRYVVNYGIGRYISREDALEIIQQVQKKGAIHQVFHESENINLPEIAICNCCWDCCGVLASYNRGAFPLHLKTYYTAQVVDSSLCKGCGKCEKYCPVNAISMENEKSSIDTGKCIGCGQCTYLCPEGTITLESNERNVLLPLQKRSSVRALP